MTVCDINLIAARRAQKQRTIAILRCAVYSLIAILVAVTLLYAKMWMATRLVEGQIAVVEGELANPTLASTIERIQFLETNIADYGPRVDLLEKVHDSEQAWIDILSDLSVSIPKGVWISQMTSRRGPNEQTIALRGSAYNQRDIGRFMLQVEKLKWSQAPGLGFTQANVNLQGHSVVDFEVSVPLNKIIGSDLR
ncbi:MAG: PilN domain-containing protein [Armatimonadota bacterium]|nr:PilN domain-containing protein [Armatimonadota bacterium]